MAAPYYGPDDGQVAVEAKMMYDRIGNTKRSAFEGLAPTGISAKPLSDSARLENKLLQNLKFLQELESRARTVTDLIAGQVPEQTAGQEARGLGGNGLLDRFCNFADVIDENLIRLSETISRLERTVG